PTPAIPAWPPLGVMSGGASPLTLHGKGRKCSGSRHVLRSAPSGLRDDGVCFAAKQDKVCGAPDETGQRRAAE
ncbi:MAG: hypothetical protein ACPIOQ_43825, partial [Promethearchaeia archaeon]